MGPTRRGGISLIRAEAARLGGEGRDERPPPPDHLLEEKIPVLLNDPINEAIGADNWRATSLGPQV